MCIYKNSTYKFPYTYKAAAHKIKGLTSLFIVNVFTFFKMTWNLYSKDNGDVLETNCGHIINLPN